MGLPTGDFTESISPAENALTGKKRKMTVEQTHLIPRYAPIIRFIESYRFRVRDTAESRALLPPKLPLSAQGTFGAKLQRGAQSSSGRWAVTRTGHPAPREARDCPHAA